MQHLEVICAVRRFFKSLRFKGLSVVDIATRMEGPGFEIRRRRADCIGGPPCLLYNGCRFSLPVVKRPERGTDHPPYSSVWVAYNHTFTVT